MFCRHRISAIRKSFLLFLFSVLFLAVGAVAQTGTTSLRGVVTDKTGASVAEAKVSLDNSTQAFHRDAVSTAPQVNTVLLPCLRAHID